MAITMQNIPSGINMNNNILSPERPVLEAIQNRAIDFNRISNSDYSANSDGTILKFIAPINIGGLEHGNKADVTDTCGISYRCVGGESFEIPLQEWQGEGIALDTCAFNMLNPDILMSTFADYINEWTKNRLSHLVDTMLAVYPETAGMEKDNIINVTEHLIAILEENGFDRADMVVGYSTRASSIYRKAGYACCELRNNTAATSPTANPFAAQEVINFKNFLKSGAKEVDVIVYIRRWLLAGSYCTRIPSVFEGVEKFRGFTLIEGREGYGAAIYKPLESGVTLNLDDLVDPV